MAPELAHRIFQFDDYRRFLAFFFEEQKRRRATFSHRFFASKAGFSSSSFCLSVIKGRFNLSAEATRKMIDGLGLEKREASYFHALVQYNQSKKQKEREDAWQKIQELRENVKFSGLGQAQLGYFNHWYYPVIKELAVHPDWNGDVLQLARMLHPQLTTEEARSALHDLVDWGILIQDASGRYHASKKLLHAEGVPPIALRQIRREYLQCGIAALDTLPSNQRFATFSSLAMSEDSYQYALTVLEEARQKIMAKAAADDCVEKVYELVVQMFPMTRHLGEVVK